MSDAHALAQRLERLAAENRELAAAWGQGCLVLIRVADGESAKEDASRAAHLAANALACEAAARQLRAGPAEGWQPIETAPKDGTRILLNCDGRVLIGRWSHEAQFEEFMRRPGWQIFECEDGWYSWAEAEAEHWQPLPAPPAATPEPA